jgi:hypothetical protein
MTLESIMAIILSFLLGCAGTALTYTVVYSGKISTLMSNYAHLTESMNDIKKTMTALESKPVVLPTDVSDKLTKTCTQVEQLEERVDRMENHNTRS